MVTARQAVAIVQALLDHGPLAVCCHDEVVQVDLKAVGDGVVVDTRGEPAGTHESFPVEAASIPEQAQFGWSVSGKPAAASANVDSELVSFRCEAALQRAHHGRRDARGVPVHSHHRAQRLKPERIAES